jgi:hypothetical protein
MGAEMKAKDLSNHISATYRALRVGIGVIAIAFPLILAVGGYLQASIPLQGSLSAYYHASNPFNPVPGHGVMRNEFVGILFAVGAILFLYQGFTRLEDYALNLAGVLALAVAIFPMAWPPNSGSKDNPFSLHGICAVSAFVCIAYVCIFRASDTLALIKDEVKRKRYHRSYLILGVLMVALPLIAASLRFFAPLREWTIFFVEVAGLYVFAAYWLLKSFEVSQTDLDKRVTFGKLRVGPHRLSDAFRQISISPVDDQNVEY